MHAHLGHCREINHPSNILWTLRNKLELKEKEVCETLQESGELMVKGSVEDEEETGRVKRGPAQTKIVQESQRY